STDRSAHWCWPYPKHTNLHAHVHTGLQDFSRAKRQQNGRLNGFSPVGAAAKRARTMTSQRTSPPWSGSETGEYGRRPGGGASEASHETPWSFPAVLRTAPPRHFVPLPQQAGGEIQRGQSDVSPVERQRQGALTMTSQGLLPRGAAAERGSTAESREGARAKRARKPPCGPGGRYGPRPLHFADRYIGEEARPAQVPRPEAGGRYRRPNGVRPRGRGESDPWLLARLRTGR